MSKTRNTLPKINNYFLVDKKTGKVNAGPYSTRRTAREVKYEDERIVQTQSVKFVR